MDKLLNFDNSEKYIVPSDTVVSIGYADKPKKNDLELTKFPSKIGGSPIWLFPFDEKNEKEFNKLSLKCEMCKENLYFLCQLYAPLEKLTLCFHRYLYIFFCKVIYYMLK